MTPTAAMELFSLYRFNPGCPVTWSRQDLEQGSPLAGDQRGALRA
jgi:hypothetical protein